MSAYQEMIVADLGCSESDASMVENIMRDHIFQSTLDWQSRAQLRVGARQAFGLLNRMRPEFEAYFRGISEIFEAAKQQEARKVE